MSFKKYLKDKFYFIFLFLSIYLILLLLFLAFKIDNSLIIAISIILFFFFIITLTIEYFRKRTFYNDLLKNIERISPAYLVLETLEKPEFYDGEILYQALYEINKSMNEFVKNLDMQMEDFKEFIEMWIHEVKIPIASLVLMAHNHQDKYDKKSLEQIKRIEDYVEQVLYYVRSENSEKDYLIKEVSLKKVINAVALKNKDDILENNISLKVDNTLCKVYTDSKWLEFIINQIINNSIKYKREDILSYIKVEVKDEKNKTTLIIEDNGIGIPSFDIPKVFDKSFTGHNGRIKTKSTGMGLFIAKNLCEKLGHKIAIESKENAYTRVYITFSKNKYYDVIKNVTKM